MAVSRDTRIDTESWPYNPKFQDFCTFLGFGAESDKKGVKWGHDKKTAEKIEEIYLWGRIMAGSADHEAIKETVYGLRQRLGQNWIGETLVDGLWQHIKFDVAYKAKRKALLEKGLASQETEPEEEPKETVEKELPASGQPIAPPRPIKE